MLNQEKAIHSDGTGSSTNNGTHSPRAVANVYSFIYTLAHSVYRFFI